MTRERGRGMRELILERDAELDVLAAVSAQATAGQGSLVLIEGPAGAGKTRLLAAVGSPVRVLSARGLAPEEDFSFGIVRQLFEPVRGACEPGEWHELCGGPAYPARCVFDGGPVAGDDPHATTHGLYWLTANLAARGPLLITVDDSHWADAPSLRWLTHLAARIEDVPVALLIAAGSGPGQPALIAELRAFPWCSRLPLSPLSEAGVAVLAREYLGGARDGKHGDLTRDDPAWDELCAACFESTDGNPFLANSLLASLAALRDGRGCGATVMADDARAAGPEEVARATLRRAGRLGAGGETLTRAIAVLGAEAPLRHVAALAGQDIPRAARLADGLRAADVLAPGPAVKFAHAIVGTAVYRSIPPGERALAHARAARLLEADGADAERIGAHLLRSLPAGDAHVIEALVSAARCATSRGAPDMAIRFLRRALDEPPPAGARAEVLLEQGLAFASVRDPAAVGTLRDAVTQVAPAKAADAALISAGALSAWGHHDSAVEICRGTRDALGAAGALDQVTEDRLAAGMLASSWLNASSTASAWASSSAARSGRTGDEWRVFDALSATIRGERRPVAMAHLGPLIGTGLAGVEPNTVGVGLLVLTWNDEFDAALHISGRLLAGARERGSVNAVADMCCRRSAILRRLGRLQDAATEARDALDSALKSSPPLAVAWAAAPLVEALTLLGQLEEADEVEEMTAARRPPAGWLPTIMFAQARGLLRVAQHRYQEALDDALGVKEDWCALGVANPSVAWWRTPAVQAFSALGRRDEAAALAAEQLELARQAGTPMMLGTALGVIAPFSEHPVDDLREAVHVLEGAKCGFDAAWAMAQLGAHLRRAGRRADAQQQLRRALDQAERRGAMLLCAYAREELHAAGARPRRSAMSGPDSLTGAERQVATLAADGLSNRQIAQHLFISQATVETHLRHTFAKLGISSRRSLPLHLH